MTIDKIYNEQLKKECLEHFNEPMLVNGKVGRCIGYAESECDAYIIIKLRDETIYHTMVGGHIFLGILKTQNTITSYDGQEWDDLYRLDSELELNGVPKEETFIVRLIESGL